jgi:hypothetical protein
MTTLEDTVAAVGEELRGDRDGVAHGNSEVKMHLAGEREVKHG